METGSARAELIIDRHKQMLAEKQPWLPTYQKIGKFVMTRKQNFMGEHQQGAFLTGSIFDSTAVNAAHLMKSYMIGALWPNAGKTFELSAPDDMDEADASSQEVKEWYSKAKKRMGVAIDHPKSGFSTSLDEYMFDQAGFGTSGIGVFDNEDPKTQYQIPCKFKQIDVKRACIAENFEGVVDTVYTARTVTVRQMVQEYKIENVSPKVREAYEQGRLGQKVKLLHAIEPRIDSKGGFGNKDYPIASIHIDMDCKHILRESGYHEMPIFVSRFWKVDGEIYGRSPSMECMPDIIEINNRREMSIAATEKALDPPLLADQGSIVGGKLDTSANTTNFRFVSGRMGDGNHRPVEPLVTIGEQQSTNTRIAELREIIRNNYFIDRLGDLNNETRMTFGEADIRNELRGQSLGTIYSRQITELLSPLIERVFNIMFVKGLLGVARNSKTALELEANNVVPFYVPDAIVKRIKEGKDVFKITFISPAALIMRDDEMKGIQKTLLAANEMAQVNPDVLDNIDYDRAIRDIQDLSGAPAHIMKSKEEVAKLREAKAQQQAQMMQMQAQMAAVETAKTGAQAAAFAAKAQGSNAA